MPNNYYHDMAAYVVENIPELLNEGVDLLPKVPTKANLDFLQIGPPGPEAFNLAPIANSSSCFNSYRKIRLSCCRK